MSHPAAPLHVDAAAKAAALAVGNGPRGICNVADDDGAVTRTRLDGRLKVAGMTAPVLPSIFEIRPVRQSSESARIQNLCILLSDKQDSR